MEEKEILSGEELKEVAGGNGTMYYQYVVKKGDTLSKLAKRFGTTVKVLVELNHIPNPDLIRIGQVLLIPKF